MNAQSDPGRKNGSVKKRSPQKRGRQSKQGNVFLSGLKNFGIVFVLCLVVFGLIASLAVSFVTSAVDDIFEEKNQLEEILKKDAEVASSVNEELPLPDGDSFTVFVAVTDYDPVHYNYFPYGNDLASVRQKAFDHSMGILSAGYNSVSTKLNAIVRFDKDRREYTVTPVSSHTRIFTPGGYMLLGELYNTFGPQYLVDKVEAITGIGIDYYMFLDAREAPKIASALGAFNVEIAKDVYSDGAAFGTAERTYDDVTRVIPPDPIETKKVEKKENDTKKKDKDTADGTDTATTETEVTTVVTEPPTTEEVTEYEPPTWIKGGREQYHLVVSAGTVTVTANNIRALLMFDDYRASGVEERLELEFQLVRGALLRLASMSDDQRLAFYDAYIRETPIDECSVTYGTAKLDVYGDDKAAEDDEEDKDEKKQADPSGYGSMCDGKINTDFGRKTAQLKNELVAAAMQFPVKHLEFEGRYVNGFFTADLTGNASLFMQYKLPSDPEKNVAPKN